MKKLIYVLIIVVFFLFGLSFFFKNQQSVAIQYYMGLGVEMPLTVVLLITLAIGIVVGYVVSLIGSLKVRRRLAQANKTIRTLDNGQV